MLHRLLEHQITSPQNAIYVFVYVFCTQVIANTRTYVAFNISLIQNKFTHDCGFEWRIYDSTVAACFNINHKNILY